MGEGIPPPPTPTNSLVAVTPVDTPSSEDQRLRASSEQVEWGLRGVCVLLVVAFASVAAVRLAVLFSYPYPPGSDVAEQLFWTHQWLGTAFPGQPITVPPVYLLLYYLPLTTFLPMFTGMELLMGVTPALLVFPTYLLLRESRVSQPWSLFGAAVAGFAPTWSLLLSWNAGYSLFSFLFVVLFFAGLVGTLYRTRPSRIALAGVAFGLTAGSDYLSFLFVVIAFAAIVVMLALWGPSRRPALKSMAWVSAIGLIAASPFALVYLTLAQQIYNVGGPMAATSWGPTLWTLVLGAWGPLSLSGSLVAIADVVFSGFAVAVMVVRFREHALTKVVLATVVAGVVLTLADPQNPTRGAFYIPLVFGPVVALVAEELYRAARRVAPDGSVQGPTADPPTAGSPANVTTHPPRWYPDRKSARPMIALALVVAFLASNGVQSYATAESAHSSYSFLNESNVAVLNWISGHTNSSAVVFTTDRTLTSWIWGAANRQAFAPAPLTLENTRYSYGVTYQADLAALGQYVVGNQYLTVGTSGPLVTGTPLVYVRSPSFWFPVFSFDPGQIQFVVNASGSETTLGLESSSISAVNLSSSCPNCAGQSISYRWNSTSIEVTQQTTVVGSSVAVDWRASSGVIEEVNVGLAALPTGTSLSQVSLPLGGPTPSVSDSFSLSGAVFSVTLNGSPGAVGPSWTQERLSSGWVDTSYAGGPEITFAFQGLAGAGSDSLYSYDTSTVLGTLGVNYMLVKVADSLPGFGYLMWSRCTTEGGLPGYTVAPVFSDGTYYVFSLTNSG